MTVDELMKTSYGKHIVSYAHASQIFHPNYVHQCCILIQLGILFNLSPIELWI